MLADQLARGGVVGQSLFQHQGGSGGVAGRAQGGGQFLRVLGPAGVQSDGPAQERNRLEEVAPAAREPLALAEGAAGLVGGLHAGPVQEVAQLVVIVPVRIPRHFVGDGGQRVFADRAEPAGQRAADERVAGGLPAVGREGEEGVNVGELGGEAGASTRARPGSLRLATLPCEGRAG